MKTRFTFLFVLITISILCCSCKVTSTKSSKMTVTYSGTKYDLNSITDITPEISSRQIGNTELQTTTYEIEGKLAVSIAQKPDNWGAKEAIDKWQNSIVRTWKNNSIGVKRLHEKCHLPCKDLVFTFVLEGLYYYSRVYVDGDKIIELMAIYDDPNEYQNFRQVYESFGK